jgi:predicted nucleic acid-binding protein
MTVFLDANVPMYLAGAPHPNKARADELIDELLLDGTRLVTDAEVFQELLHRYSAINRPKQLVDAFAVLSGFADDVFSIGVDEIDAAKALVLEGVGSRDAIHVATMRAQGVARILTFDRGFDRFADLERLS